MGREKLPTVGKFMGAKSTNESLKGKVVKPKQSRKVNEETEKELIGWVLKKFAGEEDMSYQFTRFKEEAEKRGITLRFFAPSEIDLVVTRDDRRSVVVNGTTTALPDFVLPRLGSATSYYALAVIRHLERLGVATINESDSIAAVKDKMYSMQVLAEQGLPVPKTMLVKFPIPIEVVKKQIGFPLVLKTVAGSLGNGVHLIKDESHFDDLMGFIQESKPSAQFILQEFIDKSFGKDLRVVVVGDDIVGAMMRESQDGSFKANFSRGGKTEKFTINDEIKRIAIEATKALGLEISGVDLLFDGENSYKICEVNSSPGFHGFEQAYDDVDVAKIIFDYIISRVN